MGFERDLVRMSAIGPAEVSGSLRVGGPICGSLFRSIIEGHKHHEPVQIVPTIIPIA